MRVALPRPFRQALAGLLLLPALTAMASQSPARESALSADGLPQRLVLALDGIPYDVFADLQKQGHFAGFGPAARMVSTFPSLSDVAFAEIGGEEPPEGYQNMRFDPQRNRVVGNTLASLSSRQHPSLIADSENHSSVHRMVGYMAAYNMAVHDLRQIARDLLLSDKQTYVAYLEQSDAVLHVEGRPGAERFLLQVDAVLQDLQKRVRERSGRELLVDIVSDHGSTMVKGQVLPIEKVLRQCDFRRGNRLGDSRQVAYSLAGIIGSVAITTAPEHVDEAARCLAAADGVDLVAVDRGDSVGVLNAQGEAQLRPLDANLARYEYRVLRGDPLGLVPDAIAPATREFDEAALFQATRDSARPDPIDRLWRAFQPSPILVSLADGREAGNSSVRALARVRGRAGTHGSMTRLASLGVLASNWREVHDVDTRGANETLFGRTATLALGQLLDARTASAAAIKLRSSP
jgi:hypothetical protein